jgi:D-apionolactonase
MAPNLRLHVGPVTLQPRFNPVATDAGARTKVLPDPRLSSLWAAAWTLGSVAALTHGGAQELTFFEALGERAIMPARPTGARSPSTVYPLCEVLRQLGEHYGDAVVDTHAAQAGWLAVLAVGHGADLTLFMSNLSPTAHAVRVEDVGASFSRASLDLSMAEQMGKGIWEQPTDRLAHSERFELGPHEVAVLTSAGRG